MRVPESVRRRFLAPEVIQTSVLDCGPAALKSLLSGFGIPANYGRLREACRTDLDGTSVDTLEELATHLRLDAHQVLVPIDHLGAAGARALPAIVVVKEEQGLPHFVVAWRRHGQRIQVMDPATGRRWPKEEQFLEEVHVHEAEFEAEVWRRWAGTRSFLEALEGRIRLAGVGSALAERVLERALEDPTWTSLAALDAATRLTTSLSRAGGLDRRTVGPMLEAFFERAHAEAAGSPRAVPHAFWSVRPSAGSPERLLVRGAVIVHVRAAREATSRLEESPEAAAPPPPRLLKSIEEPEIRPGRELVRFLREDGLLTPAFLAGSIAIAALGTVLDALLFRGLLDLGPLLRLPEQRLGLILAIVAFLLLVALLEVSTSAGVFRMGRKLEARLRLRLLHKIPRMEDRFLKSRLTSDMAERSHSIVELHQVPSLGGAFVGSLCQLFLTTAGVLWLAPSSAPQALLLIGLAMVLPFAVQPVLQERDLRFRSLYAALGRFHLDGLLGLVALRAHGAERALRRIHESTLVRWARSGLHLKRASICLDGVQSLASYGVAIWLLTSQIGRTEDLGAILLLVYWVLQLPILGAEVAGLAQTYPSVRNVAMRLIEPLGAPEEAPADARDDGAAEASTNAEGIELRFETVSVQPAGHPVLEEVNLLVDPGMHVAIVGPSGAGKTSLLGVLLGWQHPTSGHVLVDGEELDASVVTRTRQQTAWVDPTIQLWNRHLLENVAYGAGPCERSALGAVVDSAELRPLLERLPAGFATSLGEDGGLVSGGEGQRVRLARAFLRREARLVLLDEPFRGLERETRTRLLLRARSWWQRATLLCVTHDVAATRDFDRVVVLENGRVVECGAPEDLASSRHSRYARLLAAEDAVRDQLWGAADWRRVRLENGALVDRGTAP